MKTSAWTLCILVVFLMMTGAIGSRTNGNGGVGKGSGINSPLGTPVATYININKISTVLRSNGTADIDVGQANSGFVYPKGSSKAAIFESGLLWGALVPGDPQVRVGGSAYTSGMQCGKILSPGVAESPDLPKNRIYRVRPNWRTADLSSEVRDEGRSAAEIRAQYELDWNEWPAADGAPYKDVDNNNVYNPEIDIPGVPLSDQTVWFVANDLNTTNVQNLFGARPLGVECQYTVWAYAQEGALGNMIFKSYLLINKSTSSFDSMYVAQWSDPDLGNAADDYAGCDTSLSLGYVYNAGNTDATYQPLPPPAAGFDFFQGPVVPSPGSSAISRGRVLQNSRNLPMTAFFYFINNDPTLADPTRGAIAGSSQAYNFFRGRIGLTGQPFQDPAGNQTSFALTGNPQTRSGWIDGQQFPAGDRRIGLASGPFTMAAGDTQEIVVAELAAGAIPGVDRLNAVGLLKFYDKAAQFAYDNFFQVPSPPPTPKVAVAELNNEILLNWGNDFTSVNATENSDDRGFRFQGYNVYQLPSASAGITQAKLIATFDVADDITRIIDNVFDPQTGVVSGKVVQLGTDSGIKRFLHVTTDALNGGTPLINGVRYYFAVTSYSYTADSRAVPNNLENPLQIITVVPHSANPGVAYGHSSGQTVDPAHAGTASGGPEVTIVDPSATTGHEYEVYYTERAEIRNENGNWIPSSIVTRANNPDNPDTLTGSSIDIAAVHGITAGVTELHFTLNLVSVDNDFADGIRLSFPQGTTILSAPDFVAGNGNIAPAIAGNVVSMGDTTHPNTGNGPFAGGEEWIVSVSNFVVPNSFAWKIFDDGFGGAPVDAEGATLVQNIGAVARLAKYWNLKDATAGAIKLENQSVIGGIDLFPRRDDILTNPGTNAAPIVDGFSTSVNNVVYDAPINYLSVALRPGPGSTTRLTQNSTTSTLDVQNYTIFGGTVSSKSIDNFGAGTNDINQLQKDYELRFTGVWDSTTVNGRRVYFVASGGQMATIFGTSSGVNTGLDLHPLNPNPGTNAPFLIRIPFEVWNTDDNRQVNVAFRDRSQSLTADPFSAWNLTNRMYAVIVNSPYDTTAPRAPNADATWVLVMYGTNYTLNDLVTVTYANPVQIGVDKFTFRTTPASYTSAAAKNDVSNINVFPNPYYGVNTEELNKYNRFVTFTHLPESAVIRIYNLAGVQVREIRKDPTVNPGQFMRWDLANESGLPVGSGLYIAHIDMPDIGAKKVLKLAIVQEQQILDRF